MTALPDSPKKCYDNTRISGWKECPRAYFIRHELHWRATGTSNALVFGLSWHEGQDVIWQGAQKGASREELVDVAMVAFLNKWEESGLPTNLSIEQAAQYAPRTPEIAQEMYWNYIEEREKILYNCKLLAAEQPFAVPMPGHEDVWYIGRLDKAIEYNGNRLVIEHKTTTAYATATQFRADYIESWYSSPQVKGYEFGGHLTYGQLDGVWVDAALVHKKVHDAFRFVPVSHKFNLLEEWVNDTSRWVSIINKEVDTYRNEGKLIPGLFPKNEDSCYGKYGTCPFLDICRASSDPTEYDEPPPGYVKEVWEPFSVLGLDKMLEKNNAD